MDVERIVIKSFKEFTEDVEITGGLGIVENAIIAKEVEAIIQLKSGAIFSLGFSVMRDNSIFNTENPRNMVRKFIKENLLDSE